MLFETLATSGHEQLVFCNNPDAGLKAIVAVHSTVLGPAHAPGDRRRNGAIAVGVFLLVVVVVAWWFYPIWTGEVIPDQAWRLRMWLPTWT